VTATPTEFTLDEPIGMVHGRFQPFHLGHLSLVRAALARFPFVLVGVTNADSGHSAPEPTDPDRAALHANPFTFTERALMIQGALWTERPGATMVTPFPISKPALWSAYAPEGAVHLLRVFDEWGEEKVRRLRNAGHEVVVVEAGREKHISGTEVRRRIREGGDWRSLVPPAVARFIERLPEDRARALRRPA
jgi:cytidyltransferase-like protein